MQQKNKTQPKNEKNPPLINIEKIREMLSDRNLAEVARNIKCTRSYLCAVRSGKIVPSYYMLEKISCYLTINS